LRKLIWIPVLVLAFQCNCLAVFADESTYKIAPGDVLEISVWKDESLSREVVVPPDGVISFPLAGDIASTGMTVTQLRNIVTDRLIEYVPDATVTVLIKSINSLKAYVIGNVNNPGEFDITMNTTVMQVLAMARGLNPFAATTKVHILRQRKMITVTIPFNYKQVEKGQNLKQNITLKRGDVLVVP